MGAPFFPFPFFSRANRRSLSCSASLQKSYYKYILTIIYYNEKVNLYSDLDNLNFYVEWCLSISISTYVIFLYFRFSTYECCHPCLVISWITVLSLMSTHLRIRRNPVYCSWSTYSPPPLIFDFCLFFVFMLILG